MAAPYAPLAPPQAGTASASFAGADSATQGRWRDAYGADGYNVVGDSSSYPSYAQVSVSGQSLATWAASTSDVRGLQKATAADRLAACWYSFNSFTVDVNLTDSREHKVSLYALDWDGIYNRTERVDVLDASTGQVLDTRALSSFSGGRYLSWNLKGHTLIRFTHTGQAGSNAVVSGLFFDPADGAAAAFLRADSTTQGNWKGAYGVEGYHVVGDAASLPPYAQVSAAGQSLATWAASTGDARALQRASSQTGRLAACWYSFNSFTVDVNLTDGQAHQAALYLLDWDGNNSRAETVEVLNAATNAVLDSRSVSAFGGGRYLVWRLKGHVKLRVTLTGSPNAVVSGLFFDPSVQTVGNGLTGEYYNGDNFDSYRLTRADATVNFNWGGGSPGAQVNPDFFTARWTGMVVPRFSETYTFHTTTDDGVRLWVDGQLVIDRWLDQGATEWSGQLALQAGRSYSLRMEFYDHWGGAQARLSWSSANQAKEVVPQTCLYGCWKSAEQYTRDFFQGALARRPTAAEAQEWSAALVQAQGEYQLVGEAQGLGAQLFASAEHAARGRTDRDYVADLYWAYTQRAPDQSGWDYWTGQIAQCGADQSCRAQKRADVRAAFDQSGEFQEKVRRLCGTSAAAPDNGGVGYNFSTARLDPSNRTGGAGADPYSRNFNLQIPLVSLPGRAGLDLGLVLAYNSLVWTRDATGVTFDADEGFPSPGFRLGFPVIQPKFVNPQLQQPGQPARYSYLLITPSGARVELRQVGASNVYESADSTYLQLTEGGALTLRSTDGAQLSFFPLNGSYRCHEVRDRNGNYISVGYWGDGRIERVTDTLGRTLTFNYDNFLNLVSITQPWRRETEANPTPAQDETHVWATFGYANQTLQPSFQSLAVMGEQPGAVVPVVNQVGLADGSYYRFDYNGWGQVWKATRYAADAVGANGQPNFSHALNSTRLDLPGSDLVAASPQADCPRFTEQRVWVEHGVMNQSAEVTTGYNLWSPNMASCEVTLPDGTKDVSFYDTSGGLWKKGLVTFAEVRSGGQAVKTTALVWEHDGAAGDNHATNPRVTQTTVNDPQGNARTTRVEYTTPADFQGESGYAGALNVRLPKKVEECDAGCATVLRTTVTDYKVPSLSEYVSRRILGLTRFQRLYEGPASAANLRTQVGFVYDELNAAGDTFLSTLPSPAAQQYGGEYALAPAANGQGGLRWRGNANRVRRYSVDQQSGAVGAYVETRAAFNVTGAVAYTEDASGHRTSLGYADAFFLNINRTHPDPQHRLQTYAYPTTATDADGYTSYSRYNYDLGAVAEAQTPLPNQTANLAGPRVRSYFDGAGRVVKTLQVETGAYTRWVFAASMKEVQSFTLLEAGVEAYAASVLDGAGRVRAKASDLPGSAGGYAGQLTDYDSSGRIARQSNPTEVSVGAGGWSPAGDDNPAPPGNGPGWVYTATSYDWKGRPLLIVNGADDTSKEFSYGGCGCAGGEVVTTRDEAGRRARTFHDALGRAWKTYVYTQQDKNSPFTVGQNEAPYSTTVNSYNVRDQLTVVRAYKGAETRGVFQESVTTYDGHGRVATEKGSNQDAATTYGYTPDDMVSTVTDGRGAVTTYGYIGNKRHLVTSVSHAAPPGVQESPAASFAYDAAGNRTSMNDGLGSAAYEYDLLSRLTKETRVYAGVGSFPLTYTYNLAGKVSAISDHWGSQVKYKYDAAGQLSRVTGGGTAEGAVYAKDLSYRAWGALEAMTYGNNVQLSLGYTPRLQPASYKLTSPDASNPTPLHVEYNYGADGLLRASTDRRDATLDRAYRYDLKGRLAEALTGSEARAWLQTGSVPAGTAEDGPYRQTFSFDELDQVTQRWGRSFTGAHRREQTVSFNYDTPTGRNTAWTHDVDGRVTEAEGVETKYDAAGAAYEVSDGAAQLSRFEYDGDGVKAKRTSDFGNSFPTRTYFLRSSVLGREVAEVASDGTRATGYVYAGGELIATLTAGAVFFQHLDASGRSKLTTTVESGVLTAGRDETDPLGVTVQRPNEEPPRYRNGSGGRVGSEPGGAGQAHIASLMDLKSCDWAGMLVPCGLVGRLQTHVSSLSQRGVDHWNGVTTWNITVTAKVGNKTGIWKFRNIRGGLFAFRNRSFKDEEFSLRHFTAANALRMAAGLDYIPTPPSAPPTLKGKSQQDGFKINAIDSDFTDEHKKILAEAFARITSKECEKFINRKLAELGSPNGLGTLKALLNRAMFSRYHAGSTAAQMGITQRELDVIRENYDNKSWGEAHAYARTIVGGVGRYERSRVYLMDEIFNRPGLLTATSDTAGIIVHELFHIAGFDDPLVERLNGEIRKHCRTIGSDPF